MALERDPEGIETRYLHEFVDLPGRRVLEIGCGDGRLLYRYAPLVNRAVGIDVDADRLAAALSNRSPHLRDKTDFILAQAEQLPLPAGHFDVVIFGWSL